MQPGGTNATKTASIIGSLWTASFCKAPGPYARKEKPRGGILGEYRDTPTEAERQSELLNKAHACIFSPAARKKTRKAVPCFPPELRPHRNCVLVRFLSCQCVAKSSLRLRGPLSTDRLFWTQTPSLGTLAPALQEGIVEFVVSVSGCGS